MMSCRVLKQMIGDRGGHNIFRIATLELCSFFGLLDQMLQMLEIGTFILSGRMLFRVSLLMMRGRSLFQNKDS